MAGLLAAAMILQLYEGTNKAAAYLFDAWRNNDTTLQFPTGIHNKSLARMYNSLNMLNRHFQAIRVEHEYNEKYYRALIQHSATGLLVLDSNNRIEIMNKTACRYAGISVDSTQPDLLRIKNPLFYEAICNLNPGEDTMYRQSHGNDLQILSFRAALLRKNGNSQKLVSIQDIRYELESKELDSYRKLISVLTHEIMNLMSPLTSVSKVMVGLYHPKEKTISLADLDENILKTTLNSLQVIDEQTRGILNFLENYRKISRIPKPEIHPFPVEEWVEQLRIVYSENMARQGIH
jgi:signal transduction histidine kinase